MINIDPNFDKNTIYVKIDGILDAEEINRKVSEFAGICGQMKEHFSIVNDVSDFKSADQLQIDILAQLHIKIQTTFQLGKVIRIIGSSKLLLIKLLKADEKYKITNVQYVPTILKAEELLLK